MNQVGMMEAQMYQDVLTRMHVTIMQMQLLMMIAVASQKKILIVMATV